MVKSNIDIIVTKGINPDFVDVNFEEFNKNLSDHKPIQVNIKNIQTALHEMKPLLMNNPKYDYSTSRELWN